MSTMSYRKRNFRHRTQPSNQYSIVNSNEDDTNRIIMEQKLNVLHDDDEDLESSSFSTSSSSELNINKQLSMTSTEKQYAQTLKQIMEQELQEPEFEQMMTSIIRTLIYIAYDEDQLTDMNSVLHYLNKCTVQDAMTSIGNIDEKLATDFTDAFYRHENAAMEIMLKICIKILNMRQLIADYPMIFVPLSFHLYQPRFMTKKTERNRKLKRHRRRRQLSQMSDALNTHKSHESKHTFIISELQNDIHETEEDSLSVLSGEADEFQEDIIQKTQSLPIQQAKHNMLKRRGSSAKHARTQSRMRFQKTSSGGSLVLLPLPKRSSKIFGANGGHFADESMMFKHRLSDVSKDQIQTVRNNMISNLSMRDIDEDDVEYEQEAVILRDIKPDTKSRKAHKKSMECARLRRWTESFVFKKVGNVDYNELIEGQQKGQRMICEGCQTEIKARDCKNNETLTRYEAGESSETHKTFKKTFIFHDKYCETLRKYKEAIRQYAFESEFANLYQTAACDLRDADRYIHLFAMKDDLLVVDSSLSRNANMEDKKPHKPRVAYNDGSVAAHVSDAGLRRERRLALLNLWREAELQRNNKLPIDIANQAIEVEFQEINEFGELPELLRYIDVSTFGRPLWYFCVDQLSTKDRAPLWCILEFLATELPTSMAINLLRSTRDALVRFHVEPLDNVCLKIMASSSYPIATALYLAAFMQSNAIGDSSREHRFNDISSKYIAIATDLLSQIESDHLLAILIEIPSNIENLSILDIVVRFKLEHFLEFHRLQPIFMNMWTQYQYLDPSKPFRNSEADSCDILSLCWYNSALFYYSPIGAFTLHCTMYVLHVVLVSFITAQLLYPYKDIHSIELIVWVFNAGFVLYEISELTIRKPFGYFQYYSNLVGFIIAINWIILAVIRFHTFYHNLDYYANIGCDAHNINDVCYRNAPLTKLYMIFWSIQLILLWCRMAALLQRNKHAGPLLRMIMNMMLEICSFALLLFLFVVGFVLAVYYIVGGDVPPSSELGGGLNRISSVFLYHIQALLAAQEWGVIVSNQEEEGFDSDRSIMVETSMVLLSIFGTLLLMNLFIALLTITYESEKQNARLKTNFARITHTIELNNRSSVMPPPLNIVVFALTLIYLLCECVTVLVTCGFWTTKLQELYPIKYSLQTELNKTQTKSKHQRKGSIVFESDEDEEDEHDLFGLSAQATDLMQSKYVMDNVHCGCFVRLRARNRNKCLTLMETCKDTESSSKYCRYCRHSLSTKGDIDRYFELFKHWQLLDEDDKHLVRLRLQGRNVCAHCFRAYKVRKHGLNRCQVMLELLSYYVFKILIWWWLLPILSIPALIRKIYIRLHYNYSDTQVANFGVQMINNASQTDNTYKLKVAQLIKYYNDKENLNEKENNDTNGNNDGANIAKSPENTVKTQQRFGYGIKNEIQDLKHLMLDDHEAHNQNRMQFETLIAALKDMKSEIGVIKQQLATDKKRIRKEDVDDTDFLNITPRIVSHARTNAPMSPINNAISDLNLIRQILPKDKSTRL